MIIDKDALIADCNLLDIARRLNIRIDESSISSPDGNKTSVLCPFHNDRNFGSAFLLVKGTFKGMHCFSCDAASVSVIQMVMRINNCSFVEACKFIAEDLGGIENYYIPGSENEYDLKYKNTTVNKSYDFPAIITSEEAEVIGLSGKASSTSGLNGCILNETVYKPNPWELEKDEFVIPQQHDNPNWNRWEENSDEEPVIYTYLIAKRLPGRELIDLYMNDKWTYYWLVKDKINENLKASEAVISALKGKKDHKANIDRYYASKKIRVIRKLDKRYRISEDTLNAILEEHNANAEKMDFEGYPVYA